MRNLVKDLIVQENKSIKLDNDPISILIAGFSIFSMIIPLVIMDFFILQYQTIYFTVMNIPKLKRSDYVVMDRYNLDGLNLPQKIYCVYCGYANGMVAYAKDIANQTEIHSCAIKHKTRKKGQEHHKDFYEYEKYTKKASK